MGVLRLEVVLTCHHESQIPGRCDRQGSPVRAANDVVSDPLIVDRLDIGDIAAGPLVQNLRLLAQVRTIHSAVALFQFGPSRHC